MWLALPLFLLLLCSVTAGTGASFASACDFSEDCNHIKNGALPGSLRVTAAGVGADLHSVTIYLLLKSRLRVPEDALLSFLMISHSHSSMLADSELPACGEEGCLVSKLVLGG